MLVYDDHIGPYVERFFHSNDNVIQSIEAKLPNSLMIPSYGIFMPARKVALNIPLKGDHKGDRFRVMST